MKILELQSDPAAFRTTLLIDTDSGPKPFASVIDDWQAADFSALDSGWRRAVVGSDIEAEYSRGWLERARGHSKSLDLGVMASWALFASRRPLSGIAAAGDQDQARLLRDAIGRLCYLNPWLQSILTVQNNRVVNEHTGSSLEIISSDAPTSYGLTPDFAIVDEISHWKKRDLWDSLISSVAKRSTCICVVITNAGLTDDWAWGVREAIRSDATWFFSRTDGCVASWITPDRLEEQRRLLPPLAFAQLWNNEWTTGSSNFLPPDVIDAAFKSNLQPMTGREAGWLFVAGVDMSVTRDSTAVVVLAVNATTGRVRLAQHRVWHAAPGRSIDVLEVERYCLELDEKFGLEFFVHERQTGSENLTQHLEADSGHRRRSQGRRFYGEPWVKEILPTTSSLQMQTTLALEYFRDGKIECYPCEAFRSDLKRLRIEEKVLFGKLFFRATSPRTVDGHGDVYSAFALALAVAHEVAGRAPAVVVGSLFGAGGGSPLDAFACRQREYAAEQEEMNRPDERRLETAQVMYSTFGPGFLNRLGD